MRAPIRARLHRLRLRSTYLLSLPELERIATTLVCDRAG
jgi:hypothetical protein